LDDRVQDVLGVIAQLRLGHLAARRHQRLGEDGEFADDLFVVIADERAQGHGRAPPVAGHSQRRGNPRREQP